MGNRLGDGEEFSRKDFLNLPQSAILWLLKSDDVAYSEGLLIHGCVKWAKYKVQQSAANSEEPADLNAVYAHLKPLIRYFRFCSMSDKSLENILRDETLLPPDVMDVIKEYKTTRDATKLPLGYCFWETDRRMWLPPDEIFIYGISPDDEEFMKSKKKCTMLDLFQRQNDGFYLGKNDDEVRISFNSQNRPEGIRARCYLEDVTITVEAPFHDATVFTSRFTSLVPYNTIVKVPMKIPAQFKWKPLMTQMRCNLYVVHHVSGTYPCNIPWGESYNLKKLEKKLENGSRWENDMDVYRNLYRELLKKCEFR
jgi:hypothetical protein